MKFLYYKQQDQMDCGPTCLRMVAKHFGRSFKLQTLRQLCEINIMSKFNKLSRAEMKNVLGGVDVSSGDLCNARATCSDGTIAMGYFNCNDLSNGEDGDIACGAHGDSKTCDCVAQ